MSDLHQFDSGREHMELLEEQDVNFLQFKWIIYTMEQEFEIFKLMRIDI